MAESKQVNKETVKDICKDPDLSNYDIYIHLAWKNEDPYEPMVDMIWEGYIEDIPEEYMNYIVVDSGKSLSDSQKGINGYYLFCSNEYEVEITETLQRTVKVNASNQEEALKKVEERYNRGEIILSADDCTDRNIQAVEVRKDNYVETLAGQRLTSEEFARAEAEESGAIID